MRWIQNRINVRALKKMTSRLSSVFSDTSEKQSGHVIRSLRDTVSYRSMPTSKTKKVAKKATKKTTSKAVKKTAKKTAKKVAKKKTTKATSKKAATKTTSKKPALRALVCATEGECFWTTDGRILENLDQLQLAFGSMDDEVFLHHVSKEKNDFADWVESVLQDPECATLLRKAKKPSTARTIVVKCLRTYNI